MRPIKSISRIFFISLLGLIGVALVCVGGNFAWQGGDVGGVLMLLAMGGMLVGGRLVVVSCAAAAQHV